MPYLVAHLIEGRSEPVCVTRRDPLLQALSLMIENDFSQLPVINENTEPTGMVTYESILRGVRNFQAQLNDLHVRDIMVSAPIFNMEDDLFELLEQLKLTNAVLIVNPENKLVGIVTSYDSTEYFRNRAENLMRIEDIEVMIKEFILLAYTREDGSIDDGKLGEIISRVSVGLPRSEKKGELPSFDDLTLSQYIAVLNTKQTWSHYETVFKIPRDSLNKLLNGIRITRNELAHFRGEISMEQSDQLRFTADWLARCQEEYEQEQTRELFQQLVDATENTQEKQKTIREGSTEYHTEPTLPILLQNDMVAEVFLPGDSRYAPLADWLNSQPGSIDQVKLSFTKIEEIIGGSLPASAHEHRAWWANDSLGHPHSKLWLEVGWRRSYLNMTEKHVTFVRIIEREKAYIDFFNELVARLREKVDIPLRDISPDGQSWIIYEYVSSPKTSSMFYTFNFARGKRFRVELYIDTGEQKTNKRIFDLIQTHQAELETHLGNISWERIDDKRASRIALYHLGAITDPEEDLKVLREWAVENMVRFYQAIEPIASEVALEVMKE